MFIVSLVKLSFRVLHHSGRRRYVGFNDVLNQTCTLVGTKYFKTSQLNYM